MIDSVFVNELKARVVVQSRIEDILTILEARFGPVPAEVKANIEATVSPEVLWRWIILAAKAASIDEFRQFPGL